MKEKSGKMKDGLCLSSLLAHFSSASRSDTEILLSHILKCQTIDLYKNPHKVITPIQDAGFRKLLKKYNNGWPVAYLTGHKEFMSLDFKVTPAVLIPRPETELLVEQAIRSIEQIAKSLEKMPIALRSKPYALSIFDIGTGSGNIAISIAKHCRVKNLRVIASDISKKALTIARFNAQRHKISQESLRWRLARRRGSPKAAKRQKQSPSIRFCYGNLFKPFKGIKADMIVSNPPYVDRAEKSRWQAGLRYEPSGALWAGKKGMAYIEKIITRAPGYIKPGGWLLLEIGQGQAKETLRIIKATGVFRDIRILNDYGNIPRVLVANRR